MNDRSAEPDKSWPAGLLYGSIVLLALASLTFVGIGAWYLAFPERMSAGGDLLYAGRNAENEIRAIYGGLELGLGFYWVWCLFDRRRFKGGLVLIGLAVGFAGVARFVGMFLNGAWETPMIGYGLSEAGGGLIAAMLAIGLQKHEDE